LLDENDAIEAFEIPQGNKSFLGIRPTRAKKVINNINLSFVPQKTDEKGSL